MFANNPTKYAEPQPSSHLDKKFNFITEYYDPQAAMIRRYLFRFYPIDNTIEMINLKTNKKFLSRTKFEHVSVNDLFIGNKIHVFSRQLHLIEFADAYTEHHLGKKSERTFGIIKPDAVTKLGEVLTVIHNQNFIINRARMVTLNEEQAGIFYQNHKDKEFFVDLVKFMASGPCFAMELIGTEAVKSWSKLIGPTDPIEAKEKAPRSLRALFGHNKTENAFHGAALPGEVAIEIDFFFPNKEIPNPVRKIDNTAKLENTTCCIIKPHIVKSGLAGEVIRLIQHGGFEITGATIQEIEKTNAEEFYEVYKGVVAEYQQMCEQLCEGPCISLEISSANDNTVEAFRQLCGPSDPEIAKHIRPNTIRAVYGLDKVKNAVHCTDLPEDGLLEVEYFLRILHYIS